MSRSAASAALLLLAGAVCIGCGSETGSAPGGEWPQFRGPDRTGVSTETGLLQEWPPEGPPLVWSYEGIGRGYSSVSVSDGAVYTMGQKPEDEGVWIYAFDERDGTLLWERRTGDPFDNRMGLGPRSTPTVADGKVYTYGPNGDLWCLDAKDGSTIWHLDVFERFEVEGPNWGLAESPLVDGELVVISTGSEQGSVVALDRHTGDLVWQSGDMTDEMGYASAVVADVGGVRQAVYFTDVSLNSIRLSDGAALWRYEKVANTHANCASPIYHDGHLFATSSYDTGAALLRLESEGDTTRAEEVYFTRNLQNHHGGVVLVDGYVYGFSDHILTCIDFETGERMWRDRALAKGSLTAADGMLYIQTERGSLQLVKATPEGFEERGRKFLATAKYSFANPVVAGGRLYARVHDKLFVYDVKDREQ